MAYLTWLILIAAAILEVGGDAVIRKGLRGSAPRGHSDRVYHVGLLRGSCQHCEVGFLETTRCLRGYLCSCQRIVRTACI
jgi:hypothetical protein